MGYQWWGVEEGWRWKDIHFQKGMVSIRYFRPSSLMNKFTCLWMRLDVLSTS